MNRQRVQTTVAIVTVAGLVFAVLGALVSAWWLALIGVSLLVGALYGLIQVYRDDPDG